MYTADNPFPKLLEWIPYPCVTHSHPVGIHPRLIFHPTCAFLKFTEVHSRLAIYHFLSFTSNSWRPRERVQSHHSTSSHSTALCVKNHHLTPTQTSHIKHERDLSKSHQQSAILPILLGPGIPMVILCSNGHQ